MTHHDLETPKSEATSKPAASAPEKPRSASAPRQAEVPAWRRVLDESNGWNSLLNEAGDGAVEYRDNGVQGSRDMEPQLAWRMYYAAHSLMSRENDVEGDWTPPFYVRLREQR